MKRYILLSTVLLLSACNTAGTRTGSGDNPDLAGAETGDSSQYDVILMPFDGFSQLFIEYVARDIEEFHDLEVAIAPSLPYHQETYNQKHRQYVANVIGGGATAALEQLGYEVCEQTVIVYTHHDINDEAFDLRFLFSADYHHACTSVISTARLADINYKPGDDRRKIMQRLLKLTNKAIGYHAYNHVSAVDRSSVMFEPVYDLGDLDSIGSWY